MAGNITQKYGTANQAITCTMTSLASAAYRQSTVIDNSSNLFQDVLITVKAKANASGTSATGKVVVYAYGSSDGSSYDGSASGTDGSYSIPTGGSINLVVLGSLNIDANAKTDQQTFSLAAAFNGSVPTKWGIVILNSTGAALDASVGSAWYQGVQTQYT